MVEQISSLDIALKISGIIVAILGVFLASIMAAVTLRTNASVNLRNKKIDVILNCNSKYDDIYQNKILILKTISNQKNILSHLEMNKIYGQEIDLYYRRFWGLKSDQFDYWLAGYIDPETIISWFMYTVDAIHNNDAPWSNIYRFKNAGWLSVKKHHEITNFRFYNLIEELIKEEYSKMSQAELYAMLFHHFEKIEMEEDKLIKLVSRKSARRISMDDFYDKLNLGLKWAVGALRRRSNLERKIFRRKSLYGKILISISLAFRGINTSLSWYTWWYDPFVCYSEEIFTAYYNSNNRLNISTRST
ncbi:hypothetical protein OMP43_17780 [Sphingomonas sp. CBMAI 2297]|uniref:hypothetical protein n=1 Tax=Sphingomonas sp. CBMAI 2297 TaxID=2991720 RepID=UPI002456751A|nr:hypothetical protein [Sphingomonas sp. CBMAI 2297]MDH4745879.1 hypothetical protein [Sphingomonas sp. CBMAI 2297]